MPTMEMNVRGAIRPSYPRPLAADFVVVRRMRVLDGARVLAHLLASDLVEVFDTIVVTDHLDAHARPGP